MVTATAVSLVGVVLLAIVVSRLQARTVALAATVAVLSAQRPQALGYEFCYDTSRPTDSAISIKAYCPMTFEAIQVQPKQLVPPRRLAPGIQSFYPDCASAPTSRGCTCFDRARARLADYFFFEGTRPVLAEEVILCAIKNVYVAPAPVSLLQLTPHRCNVSYVSERHFTVIANAYEECCVFKVMGTKYFWRTPGCTKRRLVSCVTRSRNSVAARYDIPVACTARNVYVKLDIVKRIGVVAPLARSTVQTPKMPIVTAQLQWRPLLGFVPFLLLLAVVVLIYALFRHRYIFNLYPDGQSQLCYGAWPCGRAAITLLDGQVTIRLLAPPGVALDPASVHWDGQLFFADAISGWHSDDIRLAFSPPNRLARHLARGGNALRIVGASCTNIALLPTAPSDTERMDCTIEPRNEAPMYPPLPAPEEVVVPEPTECEVTATQ